MAHIILVHGMNATAASWNSIDTALVEVAESVNAIPLPGHDLPLNLENLFTSRIYVSDLSMDDYISKVVEAFPLGADRNVCLIGHSLGGAVISHVAAMHHTRISRLIYVAAMLPDDGESAQDIISEIQSSPAYDAGQAWNNFSPHFGQISLVKQPAEPLAAPFARSSDFESLSSSYIRCEYDGVIPPWKQDNMISVYNGMGSGTDIASLPYGHLPQYDDANGLVEVIKTLL